jgi:opacity protein-like surface antigen
MFLGRVSAGQAHDWLEIDFPFAAHDPLRLPKKQWVQLSVQAGEYRTAIEHDGDSSVVRSMALLPSILVTTPEQQVQPYIGAGVGLSLTDMTAGAEHVPLQLEQNLVLQVGGGVAYHLGTNLSLISNARFAYFKTLDLLSPIVPAQLHLNLDRLDFSTYTVEFGLRLLY